MQLHAKKLIHFYSICTYEQKTIPEFEPCRCRGFLLSRGLAGLLAQPEARRVRGE